MQISSSLEVRLGGPTFLVRESSIEFGTRFAEHCLIVFGSIDIALETNVFRIPTIANNRYGFAFPIPRKAFKSQIAKADILLIHGFYLFSTLLTLAMSKHKTIYLMPHGSMEPYQESRGKFRKSIFRIIVSILCWRNKLNFLVASNKEIIGVKRLFPSKEVHLAGYGIKASRNRLRSKKLIDRNRVIIGSLSRIHPIKRIDLAISSLPKLLELGLNARLKVAGEGSLELLQKLSDLVSRLGLQNQIEFIGSVTGEEKERFFQEIDILILLSDNESFAIVVAEAISRGVPVIVRSGVAMSEFVSEWRTGIVVFSESQQEIAEAILSVASKYDYYSENCFSYGHKFDWSEVVAHWERIMLPQLKDPKI